VGILEFDYGPDSEKLKILGQIYAFKQEGL
jgi:hypothetical protein